MPENVTEDPRECLGRIVADPVFLRLHLVVKDRLPALEDARFGRALFASESQVRDLAIEADRDVGAVGDGEVHAAQRFAELLDEIGVAARVERYSSDAAEARARERHRRV